MVMFVVLSVRFLLVLKLAIVSLTSGSEFAVWNTYEKLMRLVID